MWLFKKKKKDASNDNQTMSDKAAGKIASAGLKLQSAFANGMNKLFSNMNKKKVRLLLIFFCLGAGGYSIYLVANAVISPDRKQPAFNVDQIDVPKHFDKSGDEIMPEAKVDEETFNKIQGFKKYMDSLKQNKSYLYDSIITARPFLIDTVLMLEEIYYSKKQK